MGQAGEKREESARGEGGLGLRAAAEAWGMGPLNALHGSAEVRGALLRCVIKDLSWNSGPEVLWSFAFKKI